MVFLFLNICLWFIFHSTSKFSKKGTQIWDNQACFSDDFLSAGYRDFECLYLSQEYPKGSPHWLSLFSVEGDVLNLWKSFQVFSFVIFLSSFQGDLGWLFLIIEITTFEQGTSTCRFLVIKWIVLFKKSIFSFITSDFLPCDNFFFFLLHFFCSFCFTESRLVRSWIFLSG